MAKEVKLVSPGAGASRGIEGWMGHAGPVLTPMYTFMHILKARESLDLCCPSHILYILDTRTIQSPVKLEVSSLNDQSMGLACSTSILVSVAPQKTSLRQP